MVYLYKFHNCCYHCANFHGPERFLNILYALVLLIPIRLLMVMKGCSRASAGVILSVGLTLSMHHSRCMKLTHVPHTVWVYQVTLQVTLRVCAVVTSGPMPVYT